MMIMTVVENLRLLPRYLINEIKHGNEKINLIQNVHGTKQIHAKTIIHTLYTINYNQI